MNNLPKHVLDFAQRVAQDPVKLAAYQQIKHEFVKEAVSIFGGTKPTGAQRVLGQIAGGAGVALLGAAGWALKNKYDQSITGMPSIAHEEANKELGRMHARAAFMTSRSKLLEKEHDKVFTGLVKSDDIISSADKKLMECSFQTMTRFAPNLAADTNAARSFLRTSAESGVGPSFATLQTLADAERSVLQAGGITGGK